MPPLAPGPFCQLARRHARLELLIPRGYMLFIGHPWYAQRRRMTPLRRRPPCRPSLPLAAYIACEVA